LDALAQPRQIGIVGPSHHCARYIEMTVKYGENTGLIALVLAAMALGWPFAASAQVSAADAAHIAHIEAGLVSLPDGPSERTPLAQRMDELHVPGVSIAYIHDGRIAWARGFGVTRIGGPPVTPTTLFQAASISKALTATVVLNLAQFGKFDLDTDVNAYLKSWKVPENAFTAKEKVTIRRLLSHAAGVSIHGFQGYAAGAPVPTLIQVLDGAGPANSTAVRVIATPGSAWSYSGGGFEILQLLLQDATGEPFPQLMRGIVFDTLGMDHSTFEQPLPAEMAADAATPYYASGAPVPGGAHTYAEDAAAGLWTTPSDLARWVIAMQRAISARSNYLLFPSTAREMVTDVGLGHWGLGVALAGPPDHPMFGHGGSNAGFQSLMEAFDDGDGVVIMTNSDAGYLLCWQIFLTVAAEYGWPPTPPGQAGLGIH
jgi:CubicO group peptidase (beta-lactamase class C family)